MCDQQRYDRVCAITALNILKKNRKCIEISNTISINRPEATAGAPGANEKDFLSSDGEGDNLRSVESSSIA